MYRFVAVLACGKEKLNETQLQLGNVILLTPIRQNEGQGLIVCAWLDWAPFAHTVSTTNQQRGYALVWPVSRHLGV